MSQSILQTRDELRLAAKNAIRAGNAKHAPFIEEVANPLKILALLDHIDELEAKLQESQAQGYNSF